MSRVDSIAYRSFYRPFRTNPDSKCKFVSLSCIHTSSLDNYVAFWQMLMYLIPGCFAFVMHAPWRL